MMNALSPLVQLVDDDEAVRESLALLLSTVGLRVAAWPDGAAFLEGFDRGAIGAILLDVRMPGLGGLAVIERLRGEGADQPVIMLTGHGTVQACRRAFKTGAAEFLEKPVDDDLLIETVHEAIRGHLRSRERLEADRGARERFGRLTTREREVFALVIQGMTSKEVARALAISPRTVETYRASFSAKLECDSLALLVRHYAALAADDAA